MSGNTKCTHLSKEDTTFADRGEGERYWGGGNRVFAQVAMRSGGYDPNAKPEERKENRRDDGDNDDDGRREKRERKDRTDRS